MNGDESRTTLRLWGVGRRRVIMASADDYSELAATSYDSFRLSTTRPVQSFAHTLDVAVEIRTDWSGVAQVACPQLQTKQDVLIPGRYYIMITEQVFSAESLWQMASQKRKTL